MELLLAGGDMVAAEGQSLPMIFMGFVITVAIVGLSQALKAIVKIFNK